MPSERGLEGPSGDPVGALAGDDQRVGGDVPADRRPPAAGGEEPLGVLAEDHVVDRAPRRQPERRGHARVELDRPHAGVELEAEAERHLRSDLGAVGKADVGQAGGAEKDRVRPLAEVEGLSGEVFARPPVELRADLRLLECQREPPAGHRLEDLDPLPDDLAADPVAADDRDRVRTHAGLSIAAATSMASTMLSWFAAPFHARSNAVPWSTETRRNGSPTVTLTPESPVHLFVFSS